MNKTEEKILFDLQNNEQIDELVIELNKLHRRVNIEMQFSQ